MSKFVEANEKIAEKVVGAYKKIEDGVVGAYKKVEDSCVEKLFAKDGETVEEASGLIEFAEGIAKTQFVTHMLDSV